MCIDYCVFYPRVLIKSITLKNLQIRNKQFPWTRSLSLCSLTDSEHCCHHNHNHIYNHAHCGLGDGVPGVHDRWAEPCWPQELARQARHSASCPESARRTDHTATKSLFTLVSCSQHSPALQAKLVCPKDMANKAEISFSESSKSKYASSQSSVFTSKYTRLASRCWAGPCCNIQPNVVIC